MFLIFFINIRHYIYTSVAIICDKSLTCALLFKILFRSFHFHLRASSVNKFENASKMRAASVSADLVRRDRSDDNISRESHSGISLSLSLFLARDRIETVNPADRESLE